MRASGMAAAEAIDRTESAARALEMSMIAVDWKIDRRVLL